MTKFDLGRAIMFLYGGSDVVWKLPEMAGGAEFVRRKDAKEQHGP